MQLQLILSLLLGAALAVPVVESNSTDQNVTIVNTTSLQTQPTSPSADPTVSASQVFVTSAIAFGTFLGLGAFIARIGRATASGVNNAAEYSRTTNDRNLFVKGANMALDNKIASSVVLATVLTGYGVHQLAKATYQPLGLPDRPQDGMAKKI